MKFLIAIQLVFNGKARARKTRQPQPQKMYNENGHLVLENGETRDLCDCIEKTCEGCHFPCKKCRSPKCGHECRKNRIWTFDTGMIFFSIYI